MLLHRQTAVTNFYDEEQVRSIYYPECERVMKEATGAARVVAFDHIVRNAARRPPATTSRFPPSGCTTITPPGRPRSGCAI